MLGQHPGQPLHDEAVNARIVERIAAEGADAWFVRPAEDFLGHHDPARVISMLCTHALQWRSACRETLGGNTRPHRGSGQWAAAMACTI